MSFKFTFILLNFTMQVFYKILIYPVSLLPFWALYLISDLISLFLYYVLKYRREVVLKNLKNSFPEKNSLEVKNISKKYYRHLGDLLVEGLKCHTLSRRRVMSRYVCTNPELVNSFYTQGRSVILVSAHYNNWEYMVLSLDMQFAHLGVGVGKPMSNKQFEIFSNTSRTRYGTEVVFQDSVRKLVEHNFSSDVLVSYMMLTDQSPNDVNKCIWLDFLHQETAFIYGAEYFARKYDFPVLYYTVKKVKRGWYEFEVQLVEEHPKSTEIGDITRKCASILEAQLQQKPEFWLWSHRRWKLKRPTDTSLSTSHTDANTIHDSTMSQAATDLSIADSDTSNTPQRSTNPTTTKNQAIA